ALDHTRGPLLRGELVRAGDQDTYLLVTVDHAVCDGWSSGLLRSELAASYAGAVTGRPVRLPELPLRYRDFAAAQRAAAAAGEYDHQLDWWAGRLDPGALGLAAAVPGDGSGYTGVRYRLTVPAAVADRLRRLPTTMFLTLLTALTGVLAQRTATGDVAVASMVAGRSRPEHRRLVGTAAGPGPGRRGRGRHPAGRAVAAGRPPGRRGRRGDLAQHGAAAGAGPVPRRRRRHRRAAAGRRDRRAGGGLARRDAGLHGRRLRAGHGRAGDDRLQRPAADRDHRGRARRRHRGPARRGRGSAAAHR